jgi:uncharacterized protein YbaA (DUF1428 family)
MPYFDCFLAPVPRANKAQYEELAKLSWDVLRDHGALRVVESWLDEAGPDAATYHGVDARQPSASYPSFPRAAGAGADETVVISWVEWPDKQTRDEGMAKVTADPRMQFAGDAPAFDGKRLIAGGFAPMLQRSAS